MQTLLMTEMLRATAEFKPNGQPTDPARVHLTVLREQRRLDRQERKPGWTTGPIMKKFAKVLEAFHIRTHTPKEVSQRAYE